MKLQGKITILINLEYTTIELTDELSGVKFAEIKLTPDQLNSALSRLAYTECEMDIRGLDKIGKKHERKKFEFQLPEDMRGYGSLQEVCQNKLTDGWICEGYFNSQDSFFERNGRKWARCIICRWV